MARSSIPDNSLRPIACSRLSETDAILMVAWWPCKCVPLQLSCPARTLLNDATLVHWTSNMQRCSRFAAFEHMFAFTSGYLRADASHGNCLQTLGHWPGGSYTPRQAQGLQALACACCWISDLDGNCLQTLGHWPGGSYTPGQAQGLQALACACCWISDLNGDFTITGTAINQRVCHCSCTMAAQRSPSVTRRSEKVITWELRRSRLSGYAWPAADFIMSLSNVIALDVGLTAGSC